MARIKKSILEMVALVAATFLALVIVLGFAVTVPTYLSVKQLRKDISNSSSSLKVAADAENVIASLDRIFWLMNAPVSRKIFSAAGINFGDIDDEVNAVIGQAFSLGGVDRPVKFLVAFQNSAEARGTGGLLGAYAVVVINNGTLRVERTGSDSSLRLFDQLPISMPAEFLNLYGTDPADWRNSNLSPHFPYGAKIWLALWEKQFKEKLDGVITMDPVAISYLLKATGPITLADGEQVTSTNVVKKTLVDAYKKYESDNTARKAYLVEILNAAAKKIESGEFSSLTLLQGLQSSILENRLLIYSDYVQVEKKLAPTLLGGSLDTNAQNQYRAVVQNIDGSKLDYYLKRSVRVISTECSPVRKTEVTVSLTNTVTNPQSLPAYVLTRGDTDKPANLVTGQHRMALFIYGPKGSELLDTYSPGRGRVLGKQSSERGRPIAIWDIDLLPGQTWSVVANFAKGAGPITWYDHPLGSPSTVQILDRC